MALQQEISTAQEVHRAFSLFFCSSRAVWSTTSSALMEPTCSTRSLADKVDILLVVDNSCSMAPYQSELASSFQSFIQFFVDVDVDYHIGVTTTTVSEPWVGGSCTQQDINRIPSPPAIWSLTKSSIPETSNAEQLFSQLVNVGTCGSGSKWVLEVAALALGPQADANFLRDDAELSVIFVSMNRTARCLESTATSMNTVPRSPMADGKAWTCPRWWSPNATAATISSCRPVLPRGHPLRRCCQPKRWCHWQHLLR